MRRLSHTAGLLIAFSYTLMASVATASEASIGGGWSSLVLLGKAWAVGYILVVLGVLLGIAVVGRPTKRKKLKRRIT